jgi:4-hydroxybenzoate polyprenyltransferase
VALDLHPLEHDLAGARAGQESEVCMAWQAETNTVQAHRSWRQTLHGCIAIARFDHWTKNVFVLPGVVLPLTLLPASLDQPFWIRCALGLLATGFIASSNYTINELLDAPYDRFHPVKRFRPVPMGLVPTWLACVQWLGLMAIGIALGAMVSRAFVLTMAALWGMGCVYNLRPLRTKELPYLDVLSESVNNPLRMLAGWFIVTTVVPSAALLASYWMVGCYFMGLKRFSELRQLGADTAATYRRSFRYYTEQSLLVSIVFYAAAAMLFFGAFCIRYRVELVLSFPLVALVMAIYFHMAFDRDSAVQHPEHLYRQPALMCAVVACALAMSVLVLVNMPWLAAAFTPTLPLAGAQ